MKNEQRGLIAVGLCVVVWIVWFKFISPLPPPSPQTQPTVATQVATPHSDQNQKRPETHSKPSVEKVGEEVVLENNVVRVTLNSIGGVLKNWELKKFTRNGGERPSAVSLAELQGNILNLELRDANVNIDKPIPFSVVKKGENSAELRFISKGLVIVKHLELDPDAYLMKMSLEMVNNTNKTVSFIPAIDWSKIPVEESPQRGVFIFKTPPDRWQPIYYLDGSFKTINAEKVPSLEYLKGKTNWVGAESRYFLGSIIPEGKEAQGVEVGQYAIASGEKVFFTKLILSQVEILPGERWLQKFDIYGGPKELKALKNVGANLNEAIGYGWITIVATPILLLLQFFYKVVHNYGLAIILLTILLKILLNPINRKSMESMKKMQSLQPKLKAIKDKYGDDKQKINLETMQLFKSYKVNPMGGCLPMLLQFPIYIALYQVLWHSVELYHAPFFWFYKDLSAPDPYFVTPILLGITMVIQTKMTPNPSADPAQQKMMMLMPLMFSGIMLFLPMGLVLYILVNTVMTILQQGMYTRGLRLRDVIRGNFGRTT